MWNVNGGAYSNLKCGGVWVEKNDCRSGFDVAMTFIVNFMANLRKYVRSVGKAMEKFVNYLIPLREGGSCPNDYETLH